MTSNKSYMEHQGEGEGERYVYVGSDVATLPTSNTNVRQPSGSGAASASFRTLLGRVSLSNRRPWRERLDRSAFSRPASLSKATSRLRRNASYFRVNYASILATVLALALFLSTHPFSLLTLLSLAAAWLFLYAFRPSDQPLVLIGCPFSDRETLAFLTSVGSLLILAILVDLGIVASHGAFRDPEDLFLDEQDSLGSAGRLFSYIASSSSATSSMTNSIPRLRDPPRAETLMENLGVVRSKKVFRDDHVLGK